MKYWAWNACECSRRSRERAQSREHAAGARCLQAVRFFVCAIIGGGPVLLGVGHFPFLPRWCTLRGTCSPTPFECTQQRDVVTHPTHFEREFLLSADSSPRNTGQTTPDVVLCPRGRRALHCERGCTPLWYAHVVAPHTAIRRRNLTAGQTAHKHVNFPLH